MKNLTASTQMTIGTAVKRVTLIVSDTMHEAVRKFGESTTKKHLSLLIDLAIMESQISFENITANDLFKRSVLKGLKSDYSRDFRQVYNNINERIMV